jgi:hypothetical protein
MLSAATCFDSPGGRQEDCVRVSPDRPDFRSDGDHRPFRHNVRTIQALSLLQKLSDGG